ncbi:MAG: lactate utilization protein [Paludibacter sp.]|nr:lactate utilization protein [Paludibacter sp.]
MSENSKNKILNSIAAVRTQRAAAIAVNSYPDSELYRPVEPDAVSCFKTELESISGSCILCKNEEDFSRKIKELLTEKHIEKLFCRDGSIAELLSKHHISTTSDKNDFEPMEAGITGCEFLIARTGSVLISSASLSGRQMHAFPPVHFIMAYQSQLVDYPENALKAIQQKYGTKLPSAITTITGPSRTADIEKTLVLGAHGPKELIVLLIES